MTGLIPIHVPGEATPPPQGPELPAPPPAEDRAPVPDGGAGEGTPAPAGDAPPAVAGPQPEPQPPSTAFLVQGRGIGAGVGQHTILVIDDELPFAKALSRILADRGFTVLIAGTAQDGLYLARLGRPDLILLDLLLPDMLGTDACRELLANPQTCGIPILVVSYRSGTEDEVTALENGADDFLPKPYAVEVLIARIRKQLHRRKFLARFTAAGSAGVSPA
jgi:CheY-like chemotaxis protein